METGLIAAVTALLHVLALPEVGLSAIFVIAFFSATLLPLGSEPAVFALVKAQPDLFWPAVFVATAGNTLGGMVTWWMGWAAHGAKDRLRHPHASAEAIQSQAVDRACAPSSLSPKPQGPSVQSRARRYATAWLQQHGAAACLLSWLPVVGDPLCAVAGWLRLPLWPCTFYMAVGKFARYVSMTAFLIWAI